ncbi:MAG: hypothetical protein IH840_17325 [Candidatus Heimdallarchaeota archaeon]|nr:hypothetical protein [Candidatus Heimdallarchaeota archaeon]
MYPHNIDRGIAIADVKISTVTLPKSSRLITGVTRFVKKITLTHDKWFSATERSYRVQIMIMSDFNYLQVKEKTVETTLKLKNKPLLINK